MLDAFEARLAQGAALQRPGGRTCVARACGTSWSATTCAPRATCPTRRWCTRRWTAPRASTLVRRPSDPRSVAPPTSRRRRGGFVVNGGWQAAWPAIEIYEVEGTARGRGRPTPAGGRRRPGGPAGPGRRRASSGRSRPSWPSTPRTDRRPEGPVILTDGLLDRERFFGRVHDGYVRGASRPGTAAVRQPGARLPPRRRGPLADHRASRRGASHLGVVVDVRLQRRRGARPGELPLRRGRRRPGRRRGSPAPARGGRRWWQVDLDDAESICGGRRDARRGRRPAAESGCVTDGRDQRGRRRSSRARRPRSRSRRSRPAGSGSRTRAAAPADWHWPRCRGRGERSAGSWCCPTVPASWGNPDAGPAARPA